MQANEQELIKKVKSLEYLVRRLQSGGGGGGSSFVRLQTALTSTSWDGDAFGDESRAVIDLSAVFSVPAGVSAVLVFAQARDSGSASSSCFFGLGPTEIAALNCIVRLENCDANDRVAETAIIPCDDNGDIWYQIEASGSLTMDIWLRINGYWI